MGIMKDPEGEIVFQFRIADVADLCRVVTLRLASLNFFLIQPKSDD